EVFLRGEVIAESVEHELGRGEGVGEQVVGGGHVWSPSFDNSSGVERRRRRITGILLVRILYEREMTSFVLECRWHGLEAHVTGGIFPPAPGRRCRRANRRGRTFRR